MCFSDQGAVAHVIDNCLIRDDPDLIVGVDGKIGGAEFFIRFLVDLFPKFLAKRRFWIG